MRLFIAINFNEEVKELVYNNELLLEEKMINGHITSKENIHMTMVFIGETNKPKEISDVIDKIDNKPFEILIKGLKYFSRGEKKLYYLDIENNKELEKIYHFLYDELTLKGFDIEKRDFKPHVTLAREVVLSDKVIFNSLNYPYLVKNISLMESKRVNGQLKYIEIFKKNLK